MHRYKAFKFLLEVSTRNLSSQSQRLHGLNLDNLVNVSPLRFCSSKAVSPANSEETYGIQPVENIDLSDYGSAIAPRFNFEMYADKSPLIQKYIDLGVNLYEIEKRPEQAQFLVTLTVEKIQPYLEFLKDNGVLDENIGKVITHNPFIFKEDLDDLKVRVNYLLSKKFDEEMISTIITRNSKWLSAPVKVIDERLGFLQESLKLSGDDVRKIITQAPGLALIQKKKIILNLYVLKEELGLDIYTIRKMVVAQASLLRFDPHEIISTYDFLINIMKAPLDLVLKQPNVLTCRTFILKERHYFLKSLGKAQYFHLLPGYVNLTELAQFKDSEFCEKIAKTPVKLFYDFLKTL